VDNLDKKSNLVNVLKGNKVDSTPVWLMRQAGRYLPEYRKLRKGAGSFLNLCMDPKLSAEVTLQPLKRFDLDAAIIFSDILTIPMACNRNLRFVENEGPKLNPIKTEKEILDLEITNPEYLEPVYESLNIVKSQLIGNKALIGFAGAPFTIAAYMIEGEGNTTFPNCVSFFKNNENTFLLLLKKLEYFIANHLIKQIEAGAEAIQIFESHAKVAADENKFKLYCIDPVNNIINKIRKNYPDILIIGFPRNADNNYLEYGKNMNVDCISIDQNVNIKWLIKNLKMTNNRNLCLQGNLAPETLLEGGEKMISSIHNILDSFSSINHIFNLGHGVIKETPIENVELLVKTIKTWKK
jgi:uroporphyrinogen decarboxylase